MEVFAHNLITEQSFTILQTFSPSGIVAIPSNEMPASHGKPFLGTADV